MACRARNSYSKEQLQIDFRDGIKEMEAEAGGTVKAACQGAHHSPKLPTAAECGAPTLLHVLRFMFTHGCACLCRRAPTGFLRVVKRFPED